MFSASLSQRQNLGAQIHAHVSDISQFVAKQSLYHSSVATQMGVAGRKPEETVFQRCPNLEPHSQQQNLDQESTLLPWHENDQDLEILLRQVQVVLEHCLDIQRM